ncbi:MAG: Epoxyqueuosine reductase [Verrucomicrobiales bacterium]|nr:Epoxyqueuosine reductase [Verrucomicrobiales bacterium]
MKEEIRAFSYSLGFDICRFTTARPAEHQAAFEDWIQAGHHGEMGWMERSVPKRVEPQKVLEGAKTFICLGVSYHRTEDRKEKPDEGVIARYAKYNDYHEVLSEKLKAITEYLSEKGGRNHKSLWYVDTGPILERDIAERAGVGFVGKHTNLISRQLGNWLFLSEVITTLPLEPDTPEKNRCGTCSRCISSCPTGAILQPFVLDARKCISYFTIELKGPIPVEFRKAMGNRIYGCDDCLAACPWNKFARQGSLMAGHYRKDLGGSELVSLLDLTEEEFKKRFAGSPILRTKRKGLLRNVCVALGNVGNEATLPALEKAVRDKEPLVVEHALWAIEEIKARSLTRANQ